tara:strand:- start:6727 stop:7989 length:1263 start_codon:yes stop_codon:yes gene_type:complete
VISLRYGNKTREYSKTSIAVGTSPQADFSLDSESGAPIDAFVIRKMGDRWLLESCDETRYDIAGKLPGKLTWLDESAEVSLPGGVLEFYVGQPPPLKKLEPEPTTPAQKRMSLSRYALPAIAIALIILIGPLLHFGFSRNETEPVADHENLLQHAQPNAIIKKNATTSDSLPPTVSKPERFPLTQIEEVRGSVVWIGLSKGGIKILVCSGWIADSNTVVTSAGVISTLLEQRDKFDEIITYCASEDPPLRTVNKLELHPEYNVQSKDSEQSLSSAIGWLTLNDPYSQIAHICDTKKVLSGLKTNSPVTWIGFQSPKLNQAIDLTNMPELIHDQVELSSFSLGSVPSDRLPVFRFNGQVSSILEGSPLFLDDQIIGTISEVSENSAYVVPVDRIPQIPNDLGIEKKSNLNFTMSSSDNILK